MTSGTSSVALKDAGPHHNGMWLSTTPGRRTPPNHIEAATRIRPSGAPWGTVMLTPKAPEEFTAADALPKGEPSDSVPLTAAFAAEALRACGLAVRTPL